jgi:hypothetical protein
MSMMLISSLLAAVLALLPPPGASPGPGTSPAPTATPRELKTIVTVISTPYCNALAEHFNGALVPMLANDRTFTVVNTQLEDFNELWNYPDYADRYVKIRVKIVNEAGVLMASLRPIQAQIDQLREAASLSTDQEAVAQMKDAAAQLQDAYKHQFQLSTDLNSLAQNLMEYNVFAHPHPLGGWTPHDNTIPADEKNIKVYLHYDKQINSIDGSEDKAVDIAYAAATTHCTATPAPK